MFKNWYSNFYNQLTRLNNNHQHSSNNNNNNNTSNPHHQLHNNHHHQPYHNNNNTNSNNSNIISLNSNSNTNSASSISSLSTSSSTNLPNNLLNTNLIDVTQPLPAPSQPFHPHHQPSTLIVNELAQPPHHKQPHLINNKQQTAVAADSHDSQHFAILDKASPNFRSSKLRASFNGNSNINYNHPNHHNHNHNQIINNNAVGGSNQNNLNQTNSPKISHSYLAKSSSANNNVNLMGSANSNHSSGNSSTQQQQAVSNNNKQGNMPPPLVFSKGSTKTRVGSIKSNIPQPKSNGVTGAGGAANNGASSSSTTIPAHYLVNKSKLNQPPLDTNKQQINNNSNYPAVNNHHNHHSHHQSEQSSSSSSPVKNNNIAQLNSNKVNNSSFIHPTPAQLLINQSSTSDYSSSRSNSNSNISSSNNVHNFSSNNTTTNTNTNTNNNNNTNNDFSGLFNNTFQSLVHYGDNIGARIVKCLINESVYESQSLMNQDYDIYQGPALCVTYDTILKDEHWDEIFICGDEEANCNVTSNGIKTTPLESTTSSNDAKKPTSKFHKLAANDANVGPQQHASKFISFFHISDFIAILSGYKVAFVDPYERFSQDERSYVAVFDLEHDTSNIEQFEDQFKPLEKIFNVPLLKNRYYNGTIIRLPLRTQTSTCNVSNKLVHVKDILMNAKDFMKEAHLHILFSKNVANIQFCRTKDTKDTQNIEKIYSINVEESCMETFRQKYKKINDAVIDGEFPRTSTIIITLRKQIETKIEKTEWILSIFADTMRLLNSNYFLMKLAIPISDNCDKDIRFSHKSSLISSDTGFIKTLYLTKPIICYIEDKEGILMSHFSRLNISDSLKLSHFNDAYALMLQDLTKIVRKDPGLLWSLMPDLDKNTEFSELLADIWTELSKLGIFYSCTEGWGYVTTDDMIINDVEDKSTLQEILTKVYSETNYPVVIMPPHAMKALLKHSQKDSLQIMSPAQTSDILHNNASLLEQLTASQKIELLRYLIKEPSTSGTNNTNTAAAAAAAAAMTPASAQSALAPWPASAARYILDLPLLLLANQKFVKFQPLNKTKPVYLVEKEYMSLFNSDALQQSQFINPEFPKDLFQILKKFEFQSKHTTTKITLLRISIHYILKRKLSY